MTLTYLLLALCLIALHAHPIGPNPDHAAALQRLEDGPPPVTARLHAAISDRVPSVRRGKHPNVREPPATESEIGVGGGKGDGKLEVIPPTPKKEEEVPIPEGEGDGEKGGGKPPDASKPEDKPPGGAPKGEASETEQNSNEEKGKTDDNPPQTNPKAEEKPPPVPPGNSDPSANSESNPEPPKTNPQPDPPTVPDPHSQPNPEEAGENTSGTPSNPDAEPKKGFHISIPNLQFTAPELIIAVAAAGALIIAVGCACARRGGSHPYQPVSNAQYTIDEPQDADGWNDGWGDWEEEETKA